MIGLAIEAATEHVEVLVERGEGELLAHHVEEIGHGHTRRLVPGVRAALVYGNRDTSSSLRYKFGLNLNCDPKQAVILRKPMDFMLPDDGINKNYVLAREDFYFVYPTRFHEFERQYRGSLQHGGISVEEMILPIATLTPRGR